ncbi:hypothetical protein H8356DRAFT_1294776 [Neocallimastix lanati (nom. inval.)]|nr:hypothetical protein H8356DRAFT_1294776 [Neocallimastix sp. JGI-2020a]
MNKTFTVNSSSSSANDNNSSDPVMAKDKIYHTYESLGIDALQKHQVETKMEEESSLPVINISTKNNSELILSRDNYTDCVVDIFNVEKKYKLKEKSAGIRVRGNSSSYKGDIEKIKANIVPYKIKFTDKINLLGLHHGEEFKDWVLIKTAENVIRQDASFKMGHVIFDDKQYISDSIIVKVYVNDKLQGVYTLLEQNKVHEKKVNISVPEKNYNGTDIGYYFEIDNYHDYYPENEGKFFILDYEEATVKDILGVERQFIPTGVTIKSDFYCHDQVDFIGNYTENVFKILYLATEKGIYKTLDENYRLINSTYTNAQETISAVFDMDTVVNMYLLYEIVHDYDVGEGSFYFAVDLSKDSKNKKLQMVSPWDFDWTFNDSPTRYWAGTFCEENFAKRKGDRSNPWFIEFAKQDWFHSLVSEKWQKASSSSKVKKIIAEGEQFVADHLDDCLIVSEIVVEAVGNFTNWVSQRMDWMDETFAVNSTISDPIVEQTTIDIEIPSGEVEVDDNINSSDDEEEVESTEDVDVKEDSAEEN